MRRLSLVVSALAVGLAGYIGHPRAQAPATVFHGIGDLTGGGVGSAVRDATRVGGTIYAVGASTVVANPAPPAVPNLDTPALWTGPGSGSGTLEALPNTAVFTSTQTTPISAYAITPDGAYLASQARPSNATGYQLGTGDAESAARHHGESESEQRAGDARLCRAGDR